MCDGQCLTVEQICGEKQKKSIKLATLALDCLQYHYFLSFFTLLLSSTFAVVVGGQLTTFVVQAGRYLHSHSATDITITTIPMLICYMLLTQVCLDLTTVRVSSR